MCSEVGMTRKGKLKCHDGSEVNAMATRMSVNVSIESSREVVPIFRTLYSTSYREGKPCTPHSRLQ